MHRSLKWFASVWTLVPALVVSSAAAADSAPPAAPMLPALSITRVDVRDAGLYATQIAAINAVMKAKFGVDQFLREYVGEAAGEETGAVFAVSRAESFATLMKHAQNYQSDPALADLRASLTAIRELNSRLLFKAVRFDGAHPNAVVYNTYAAVSDEAGYMAAIEKLRGLFDANGLSDVKINVYRVIAGRSNYTHLVSLNAPSGERLAALLDAVATQAWAMQWIANSAQYRTVVHNGTYREISR